jgi:hypothetical protein
MDVSHKLSVIVCSSNAFREIMFLALEGQHPVYTRMYMHKQTYMHNVHMHIVKDALHLNESVRSPINRTLFLMFFVISELTITKYVICLRTLVMIL